MKTPANDDGDQKLIPKLAQIGLPKKLVDELLEHHICASYAKGESLFRQGSPAEVVFWVLGGLVAVYVPTSAEERLLLDIAGPGETVGFADFLNAKSRHVQAFEATALSKCTLAIFTRAQLRSVLEQLDATTLTELLIRLNTYWSSTAYHRIRFLSLSFRERLEMVLADLGYRFGVVESRGTILTLELSHDSLAEMIGSSRPMVSRLIGEMTAEGRISRQGKHYILNRGCGLDQELLAPTALQRNAA